LAEFTLGNKGEIRRTGRGGSKPAAAINLLSVMGFYVVSGQAP
jgi:hypothetical protein